jgi:hypothetical protein
MYRLCSPRRLPSAIAAARVLGNHEVTIRCCMRGKRDNTVGTSALHSSTVPGIGTCRTVGGPIHNLRHASSSDSVLSRCTSHAQRRSGVLPTC